MGRVLPEDRWALVERLFQEAADLPAAERQRFLDNRCSGDAQLREEVLSLLRYDTAGSAFLLDAIHADAASIVGDEPAAGWMLGPYRIEQELGRGGMSVVYLAVRADGEFQKRIAIKLIKRGMDTSAVVERLRQERHILAGLEHPLIARLLDGGTTPDGRPWIAMEYVEGLPIGRYSAERALSIEDRCRLIAKVCEAVAYAHRNLVVHRDLKPANILVTRDGDPKLLDFGIAKMLSYEGSEDAPETRGPYRLLTPEYASPEQLNGERVGTATDVYSLGIILYELLTGERPRGDKASTAALRNGLGRRWSRQLAGDLDNILQMALRPEPERRYLSAGEFEADLEACWKGLPVAAREETVLYRCRKFLTRHRFGTVATLLIILSIAAGMTATVWEARRAEEARRIAEARRIEAERAVTVAEAAQRRAEHEHAEAERQRASADRRFAQVRELAGKFVFEFHDAIAALPGSTAARKKVVETGVAYYDSLVKEAGDNRELLEEIARGYDRLGDVLGNPYFSNLGDVPGALESYKKAAAIRGKITGDESSAYLADLIMSDVKFGQMLQFASKYSESARYLRHAIDRVPHPEAQPVAILEPLSMAWSNLSDTQLRGGENAAGLRSRLRLLALRQEISKKSPPGDFKAEKALSIAELKLAEYYFREESAEPAIAHLTACRAIMKKLSEARGNDLELLRVLRICNMLLGDVLSGSGRHLAKAGEATAILREAVAISDRMLVSDPDNRMALEDAAITGTSLGDSLESDKDLTAACAAWEKGMTAAQRLPAASGNDGILSQLYRRRAICLSAAGKLDEALANLRISEERAVAAEKDSQNPTHKLIRHGEIAGTRAEVYAAAKRWPEAIAERKSNLDDFLQLARLNPGEAVYVDNQPTLYAKLADVYERAGDRENARQNLVAALALFATIEAKRPLKPDQKQGQDEARAKLAAWK